MENTFYYLTIHIVGDGWEQDDHEIALSQEQIFAVEQEFEAKSREASGEYVAGIQEIGYRVKKYSDEQARNLLTVNEYLKLTKKTII